MKINLHNSLLWAASLLICFATAAFLLRRQGRLIAYLHLVELLGRLHFVDRLVILEFLILRGSVVVAAH